MSFGRGERYWIRIILPEHSKRITRRTKGAVTAAATPVNRPFSTIVVSTLGLRANTQWISASFRSVSCTNFAEIVFKEFLNFGYNVQIIRKNVGYVIRNAVVIENEDRGPIWYSSLKFDAVWLWLPRALWIFFLIWANNGKFITTLGNLKLRERAEIVTEND